MQRSILGIFLVLCRADVLCGTPCTAINDEGHSCSVLFGIARGRSLT